MLIDSLLSVLSLVLGVRLLDRGRREVEVSVLVFAGGFLSLAVAWAAAAVAQAWVLEIGGAGLELCFRLAALMVGLASFCFAAAVTLACFARRWRRVLVALVTLKLVVYAFWMLTTTNERIVVLDLALALAVVGLLEAWAWRARRASSAPWILGGLLTVLPIAISWLGGWPQEATRGSEILYNLGLLVALCLLYFGGWRLHDRLPPSADEEL